MNKKRIISIILLILLIFIFISFNFSKHLPEKVLIHVLDNGESPIVNANCKADIITEENIIEDKGLIELQSISTIIKDINILKPGDEKGYYQLETGLKNYKGDFEIRIVCISSDSKQVGYTIINNTNMPCDVRENGKVLIC